MINWKQMINANEIFSESDKRIAMICDSVKDTADLAGLANTIVASHVDTISILPEMVSFLWAWLEKSPVKIWTRYDVLLLPKTVEKDISDLSQNIIQSYRNGASGVQLFLKKRDLEKFTDILATVRDDLFFKHDLAMFFDISEINIDDWDLIFDKLHALHADVFGIVAKADKGKKSDYIGRIYGMLEKWNFDGSLHFILNNNFDRIDQTIRLIESERPELSDKIKFFLE